jgi:hypothetical protein
MRHMEEEVKEFIQTLICTVYCISTCYLLWHEERDICSQFLPVFYQHVLSDCGNTSWMRALNVGRSGTRLAYT